MLIDFSRYYDPSPGQVATTGVSQPTSELSSGTASPVPPAPELLLRKLQMATSQVGKLCKCKLGRVFYCATTRLNIWLNIFVLIVKIFTLKAYTVPRS